MIAKSVNHISFAVRNLEKAQDFYGGVLGLEPIERPDFGIPGTWFGAGNAQVHLIETPAGMDVGNPPPGLTPMANHQAFTIADYAETLAALKSRDVEVLETSPENGQLFIRDPDGHVIELISETARPR